MGWADVWLPAARSALVELRGQGSTEFGTGLPVPRLSVVDATSVLAQVTRPILTQLPRLGADGYCAMPTDLCDESGYSEYQPQSNNGYKPADYLAMYPGPGTGRAWIRTPANYRDHIENLDPSQLAGDAGYTPDPNWNVRVAADETGWASATKWTVYTGNPYDESGVIMSLHSLVQAYQDACDAIAGGALLAAGSEMAAAPMDVTSLDALWHALIRLCIELDALADAPPRPPTSEALEEAATGAAEWLGEEAAKTANLAGRLAGSTIKGVAEGLGWTGLAAGIAVLAIALALR